jgi:hypothetical protein
MNHVAYHGNQRCRSINSYRAQSAIEVGLYRGNVEAVNMLWDSLMEAHHF